MKPLRFIRPALFGFALLAAGASVPRSAVAESDPMTAKAATLYDEAMVAFDAKKWPEARASLLAAWALKRHWQIAGSLAEAEMKLGLFRDAAGHLAFFLRHAPPERRTEAMVALSTTARANVGTITLKLEARGADVRVDGESVGTTPLEEPVFVDPGNHRIEVRENGKAASADIDVVAGDRKEVPLTLRRLDLYHAAGPEPLPSAAEHVEHVDPPSSGPGLASVIASAAVGVVGLATGAGLTVAANSKSSEATNDRALVRSSSACAAVPAPASCSALTNAVTNKDTLSNAAVGAFVVGGAFALTAVALGTWQAVAGRSTKSTPAVTVLPSVGREGAMLTVRARW